jgi:hypothetical protein
MPPSEIDSFHLRHVKMAAERLANATDMLLHLLPDEQLSETQKVARIAVLEMRALLRNQIPNTR